jgi:hypothetical protein
MLENHAARGEADNGRGYLGKLHEKEKRENMKKQEKKERGKRKWE